MATDPSYYQTSANFCLAQCYYLTGSKELSSSIIEVKDAPHIQLPADRKAKNKVEYLLKRNKSLLKVQLLFDGGSYSEALKLILNQDQSLFSKNELLEYYYRLGRVYQELKRYREAKANFLMLVFKSDNDSHSYFAPNSCLQLGLIYFNERNFLKVKYYVDSGLRYRNYEHQTSIKVQLKKVLQLMDHEAIVE